MMLERMYTPADAANMLSITPKTVRRMLHDGTLPGEKTGRLWRMTEFDLAAFIAVVQTTERTILFRRQW